MLRLSTPLLAVAFAASTGCSQDPIGKASGSASSSAKPTITVTGSPWPASAEPNVDPAYREKTKGAVDGKELVKFVPQTLAGLKRSDVLEQLFSVAAAYTTPDGAFANVDLQNTFLRGDPTSNLEKDRLERCKTKEEIGGATACVDVKKERTSIHWFLPDRLSVTLSAPSEETARAMAKELDVQGLSNLSAAPSP